MEVGLIWLRIVTNSELRLTVVLIHPVLLPKDCDYCYNYYNTSQYFSTVLNSITKQKYHYRNNNRVEASGFSGW
jgi:hypothetical protein